MINSYDKIIDKIYIGDIVSPRISLQKKENISHVISLVPLDKTLKKFLRKKSVYHYECLIENDKDEDIIQHFREMLPKLINILSQDSTKLLIHCTLGRSRSVSLCLLILMKFFKYTYEDAFELIKSKRDIDLKSPFYEPIKHYKI